MNDDKRTFVMLRDTQFVVVDCSCDVFNAKIREIPDGVWVHVGDVGIRMDKILYFRDNEQ